MKAIIKFNDKEVPTFFKPSFLFSENIYSKYEKDGIEYKRYVIFKPCLLINNEIIFVLSDNVDLNAIDNTIQYISLIFNDVEKKHELHINNKVFYGRTNLHPKTNIVNESVKINYMICFVDLFVYENTKTLEQDIVYNAFYPIAGLPIGFSASSYDLYDDRIADGNVYEIEYEENSNKPKNFELLFTYDKISDLGNIKLVYSSNPQNIQCIINSNKPFPISSKVIIDNIEWICVKYSMKDGVFSNVFIPETLFNKTYNIKTYQTDSDTTNLSDAIVRQKTNYTNFNRLQEPFLSDLDRIIAKSIRDTELKLDNITSNDILYQGIDFNAGEIKPIMYSELKNVVVDFDKVPFTIIDKSVTTKMVKNRVLFQNKFLQTAMDFEYNANISNSIDDSQRDFGYFLFAADGDDKSTKPTNRFTTFYTPYIQMTDHMTNIISFNDNKFDLADGKIININTPVKKNDIDFMDPFRIVKLRSAQPITPSKGFYYDSLIPNLVPWKQSMVKFAPIKDENDETKYVPVNGEWLLYDTPTLSSTTKFWTKTICNFVPLRVPDSKEIVGSIVNIYHDKDTGIYRKIDYKNELSANKLFNYDQANLQCSNVEILNKYKDNPSVPPFYYEKDSYNITGLFYRIKLKHKKQLEMAQRGFTFDMNIPSIKILINLHENKIQVYGEKDGVTTDKWTDVSVQITPLSDGTSALDGTNGIRFAKIDFSGQKLTIGNDDVDLNLIYVDEIVIIPNKEFRREDIIIMKFLTDYLYFSSYNFGSPLYIGIPYRTIEDDVTSFDKYVIVNGDTYNKLRKIINPTIENTMTLKITKNISDVNNITKNISDGFDKFPCKIKLTINNIKREYFVDTLEITIDGDIATYVMKIDDRNNYLELDNMTKDISDVNIFEYLPNFELRRRIMNLGFPSDYIFIPPMEIDTFLKHTIAKLINDIYNNSITDYTKIPIKVVGSYIIPKHINCSLDGIYKTNQYSSYLTLFDMSGYGWDTSKIENGKEYWNKYVPFNMNFPLSLYYSFSFTPYTLFYKYDVDAGRPTSFTLTLLDESSLSEFVYPKYGYDKIEVDLKTDCVSYFTIKSKVKERYAKTTNTLKSVNSANELSNLCKLEDNVTDRKITINASYPIDESYNIRTFDLRPDNPAFTIIARKNIKLNVIDNKETNTNLLTDCELKEDNKDKWKEYIDASVVTKEGNKEIDEVYNANSIYLKFKERKDANDLTYKISLPLPHISIVSSSNITGVKRFLFIRTTKLCDLSFECNGTPIKYLLVPGDCRVIPLCDLDDIDKWISSEIYIDNITQGTEIEIFGFAFYTNDGFTPKLSKEQGGE